MADKNDLMQNFTVNCISENTLKCAIPAESKGGQQQDHEDQERIAFVHCGPVLS